MRTEGVDLELIIAQVLHTRVTSGILTSLIIRGEKISYPFIRFLNAIYPGYMGPALSLPSITFGSGSPPTAPEECDPNVAFYRDSSDRPPKQKH